MVLAFLQNTVGSGDVLNYVTRVMKLTRGKLLRQDDWSEWQTSEFLQLDQYDSQDMFGSPEAVESNEAVFNLVWSYGIKALDARKKARCTCSMFGTNIFNLLNLLLLSYCMILASRLMSWTSLFLTIRQM
jgi:hypothetical protein